MAGLFSGLNTARSGLIESQTAINVTSHNITNANTDGYTRETLTLRAIQADSGNYRYKQSTTLVGNGVADNGVVQSRDSFLDMRYRDANSQYSDYNQLSSSLSSIEDIFNEFTSSSSTDNEVVGLSGQLSGLMSDLHTLASSSDTSALPVTIQSDVSNICATIRSDYQSLTDYEDQIKGNLQDIVTGGSTGNESSGGINAMLDQISQLNTQIASYEITGQSANDLRDQRNLLLDQLSGYMDITVKEDDNGMVEVGLQQDSTSLIDADNNVTRLDVHTDSASGEVSVVKQGTDTQVSIQGGSVDAYLQLLNGGRTGSSYENMGIPYFKSQLEAYATTFMDTLNNTATAGNSSISPLVSYTGTNVAATINLSDAWQADRNLFVTDFDSYNASQTASGDPTVTISGYASQFIYNMQTAALSDLNADGTIPGTETSGDYSLIQAGLRSGTLAGFAESFTSDIAHTAGDASQSASSAKVVVSDLDTQRQSVSSVSMDEEAINIIKYQQAYNASARIITTIDEMLDKLINGTAVS